MSMGKKLNAAKNAFRNLRNQEKEKDDQKLMMGRLLQEKFIGKKNIKTLSDVEFKVFSQWGDDGIIQWLVNNLDITQDTFVEFGVEDYEESNTRFLLINNNWSGLVMDASNSNIERIKNSHYYWKYDLTAKQEFVTRNNVNDRILSSGFEGEVGLLHIDIDGVDYWVWKEISVINPEIVILEYNSVFGTDRPITIPYDESFSRTAAHYSNLYYGASLPALKRVSEEKSYSFVGCNGAGNNAYFVRDDKLNKNVSGVTLENGYVASKFREGRQRDGALSYLSGLERYEVIKGLPVYNLETEQLEEL